MASTRRCCLLLVLVFATIAVFHPGGSEAQLGNIIISGTVPCSTGSGAGSAPGFPNATVVLKCGKSVIASTTTTIAGAFRFQLSNVASALLNTLLNTLLNDCVLAVVTPLSACNSLLPSSGILSAPLQLLSSGFLGGILSGLLGSIGIGDFNYSP